jgi:DNA-binding response OmpR family regulator
MDKTMAILVVEDIISARETVIHMLRALGYSVFFEAENGIQAFEKIKENEIDLVISDWNMPKMNGLALLRAVRTRSESKTLPFLFLTSRSEVEDIALASDSGVSGYLIKPLGIKNLSEALTKVFEEDFEQRFGRMKERIHDLCVAKEHGAAEELLRDFETLYPAHENRIRLELVHVLMRLADYPKAEEILCRILSANSLFSKGWETLARLQSWQGKWIEALCAVDKAVTISPNNTDYHILRGAINLHRENMHEARRSFMTALNIDRKNDQVKQDIWNTYVEMDMVEEVQRDFGSYIFSALNCDTLNNMAVAYRRKGELVRAVETYRVALAKEPDNPKILFNAAVAYVSRKQLDKARELLVHALGNDPGFEQARTLMRQIGSAGDAREES